jgi:hypothetical protein
LDASRFYLNTHQAGLAFQKLSALWADAGRQRNLLPASF